MTLIAADHSLGFLPPNFPKGADLYWVAAFLGIAAAAGAIRRQRNQKAYYQRLYQAEEKSLSEQKETQQEVLRLNRLFEALSQTNQAIVRARSREELFERICRAMVEHGKFRMAWIGWINPKTKAIEAAAKLGDGSAYVDSLAFNAEATREGRGPMVTCIQEARTYVCNNLLLDPIVAPWRQKAMEHGLRALIAVPFRFEGQICGALAAYAGEENFFGQKEIALIEEAANDLSFALDNLDRERKREKAEAALKESEQRLKFAMEGANDGIWDVDLRSGTVFLSQRGWQLLGYSSKQPDPSAATWQQMIHLEDLPATERALSAHLDGQATLFEVEQRLQTKSGDYVWILARGKVSERDESGMPIRMTGTHTDISLKKRHEEELQRGNRLYATLSAINQAIVRTQSRKELFEQICQAVIECGDFKMAWIGWLIPETSEVEIVARAGESDPYLRGIRVFADDRPEGRGPTGICIRESRSYVCNDFSADPVTGPWRERASQQGFAASIAIPIYFQGAIAGALTVYGSEKGVFGKKEVTLLEEAAHDVSFALDNLEKEQLRRGADEANHRLMVAIDQAAEAIVFTDTKGTILFVNQGFETVTGYARHEAIGNNPRILKSGKQSEAFYNELWNTISSGHVWRGHFSNKRKDGTIFEEDATISPIRNSAGKIISYVAVKRDITREVQLERQLFEAQKMDAIGQLAGGVAHDYNNILAANMMGLEILLDAPSLTPETRELIQGLQRGEERAADLTRQLLMFSRRQAIHLRKLELNSLLEDELKMLRRLLGEHIDLIFQAKESDAWIEADAGMMEQVIMNLCINARDAMPKGGRLTVGIKRVEISPAMALDNVAARPGKFACLSVADAGSGIPEEIRERIFEPFFTTKEIGKGTGLGLATVYGIVKQHEGWIEVRSELGKGSEFCVYLPLACPTAAPNKPAKKNEPPKGTETILVVEDEPSVRKTVAACLNLRGYRVLEACNGAEAQENWSKELSQLDLLLTDMIMPGGMTGLELADSFQAAKPSLPVIIMSGYSAEFADSGLPSRPRLTHLLKPCNSTELAEAIRKALDEAKQSQ